MQKLPIGISTFKEIRKKYGYYVDKTLLLKKLVDNGKYYFMTIITICFIVIIF